MQGAAATDSQLPDCFVRACDSAALGRLVVRHGPAALQVCRGILHDTHEAEDAFQATFTVAGINGSGDDLGRCGPSSSARIEVCRYPRRKGSGSDGNHLMTFFRRFDR